MTSEIELPKFAQHAEIPTEISKEVALLMELGFQTPTLIQERAMPILAMGDSLNALAATGSGKTLAFLIPLLLRIDPTREGTQLLILAPTRELGAQIAKVANVVALKIAKEGQKILQIRTAFGGQKAESQKQELLKDPHVVVATPGRALDCMRTEAMNLDQLQAVVLDEADLMLSMGFGGQMESLFRKLPVRFQTVLFSATESTLPGALENRLLRSTEKIDVREETHQDKIHEVLNIRNASERHIRVSNSLKSLELQNESGIIFCQTRECVNELSAYLKEQGISAEALSGELGQIQRDSVLRRFKANALRWLVSTNIAARGIDVTALPLVINYDLPATIVEYLHRAGRTGRAGRSARVLNVCPPGTESFLKNLIKDEGISLRAYFAKSEPLQNEKSELGSTEPLPTIKDLKPLNFRKIHISRGKSDKVRPGDVLGVLTKQLNLAKEEVGGIYIFDHFTHVEVSADRMHEVIKSLNGIRVKNLTVKVTEAFS